MDKKPSIVASVCSSVKQPRIKDNIEIMCLVPSRNLDDEYGGLSLRIYTYEGINV